MTHSNWNEQRERLSAYLDSELAADERAAVEAHLADCEQCQHELAALRQTRDLLRALPAPALPRAFTIPASPAPSERRAMPAWTRPAQALGGLAAMVGLGLMIGTTVPHPNLFPRPMGGASYASQPIAPSGGAASMAPTPTGENQSRTLTPTSVLTVAPTATPAHVAPAPPAQPFPVAPVTGGTLLVGGAAAWTAGSLARRRARRLPV